MEEEALYRRRLDLALECSGLDLWENDLLTGEVIFGLDRVFSDLGYDKSEAAGYIDDIFSLMHPDDKPAVEQAIADHLAAKTQRYYSEFRIRAKSGAWVWYANYGKILDREGENPGHRFCGVSFNLDIKKRQEEELQALNAKLREQNALLERMNAELHALATSDSLTGLRNRRYLLKAGEDEFLRARRLRHELALLLIDIDWFKRVNDTLGHVAGDEVIRAIAQRCSGGTRAHVDTVGRIGGEEFAIVLPAVGLDEALELADRLRLEVARQPVAVTGGHSIHVTISTGVATLAPECQSFHDLMILSDRALYRAKDAGRNAVCGPAA
ncbi:sensor domain-containing diguanylate cyclase [uncultured Salinisphaera sp.]|uniref:GGDEF domain-containing protein n=1 Tax=uncultured Salinisphaera sp. TaxID=359372 RepID=UPI0032B143A9